MRRYNEGMIYTDDKCVACNRCVHVCPAVGANVTANDAGRISIDVSDKNCIHCGRCIKECIHEARKYNDSLPDMLLDLKRGTEISVIVDPTFVVAYGRKTAAQVFGYLRSLGVKSILDGSIGGEISLYYHVRYLRENADENGICDRFFAHTCPGFSNYVSRYAPGAVSRFIPVQLPNVCAAIYYRKYKEISGRFALLSPCTAIYDEFSSYNSGRNINYLIGFSSLFEHIGERDISVIDSSFDEKFDSVGSIISENDSFSYVVSRYLSPRLMFKSRTGIDEKLGGFLHNIRMLENASHPALMTVEMCNTGCINGPAIGNGSIDVAGSVEGYINEYTKAMQDQDNGDLSPDEKYAKLEEKFAYLKSFDFEWEGEEDYHQKCSVPENVVEEIFESMHKTTEIKKSLNCQACGYASCYEMACAVANGYSRIEECVHYLNDEMKNQLEIDSLTGLPNQRGFYKAATGLIRENPGKEYIIAVGDINGLGGINDLYSNTGGDLVIGYIAKILAEFSDKRGVCARLGAGVFGCFFENTVDNLEAFRKDTQLTVSHMGIEYPLTMKFGIYELKDRSITIGRAVLYATYAFRTTRDKSRNTYIFYTEEMSKSMYEEAEVTQKMKKAKENGEFVLYLQPKYDHVTGKMVGAEALSRWIRDDGDVVSPGVFIPVFEKNGFITELDRYVWENSFRTVTKWLDGGFTAVPVSVNISRISLNDDSAVTAIETLTRQYPTAGRYIQFEITESACVGDNNEVFGRLQKIRDLGFKVNMDDFGSGYSSLNLLKDAPIDIVKLDMGFLRGEGNKDKGKIIISHVVNMTKELGCDIVAEGVETKDQADMLCEMGCKVIQGFYYARPMPEEEFVNLL